jgi:cytochrome oxidase Cu insertion factor (SCO1/SenC/PrrC family)
MKRVILAGAMALISTGVWAQHEGHAGHKAEAQKPADPAKSIAPLTKPKRDPQAYFTDRELYTQDGKRVRFYSDVLKGKMVVINTIFTNCQDACPLITERMNEVRAKLGPAFGKDVEFISISSDPERDSPQAMKKFAQKHKADVPGWTFLTGKKADVDVVLKKLGQFSESVEAHSTTLIAWNFKTDKGKKLMPNVDAEIIANQLLIVASEDPLGLPAGFGAMPR